MWTELLTAVALLLVFEGIMPFISPNTFRTVMQSVLQRSNNTMRYVGLSSMIVGVVILTIVR